MGPPATPALFRFDALARALSAARTPEEGWSTPEAAAALAAWHAALRAGEVRLLTLAAFGTLTWRDSRDDAALRADIARHQAARLGLDRDAVLEAGAKATGATQHAIAAATAAALGLGPDAAARLAAAAREVESGARRPAPPLMALARAARDAGARVVAVTDAPWSEAELLALLRGCGADAVAETATASGLGAPFAGGEGFTSLAARAGVPPASCLHLGPGLDSDWRAARRAGWRAAHLPAPEGGWTDRASVAVIVAASGDPGPLRRAMGSVARQSFRDLRVVVTAPDPLPAGEAVADSPADARGVLLAAAPGLAGGRALNLALRLSDSEFVALHGEDVTWAPDFLEAAIARLRAPEGRELAGVLAGWREAPEEAGPRPLGLVGDPVLPPAPPLPFLAAGPSWPSGALLLRRAALEAALPFAEDAPALPEWEALLRVASAGPVDVIARPLLRWHRRADASPPATAEAHSRDRLLRQGPPALAALLAGPAPAPPTLPTAPWRQAARADDLWAALAVATAREAELDALRAALEAAQREAHAARDAAAAARRDAAEARRLADERWAALAAHHAAPRR